MKARAVLPGQPRVSPGQLKVTGAHQRQRSKRPWPTEGLRDEIASALSVVVARSVTQDSKFDGTGLRFETTDHGGEYPDALSQATRLIDTDGGSCIYVPITQCDRLVHGAAFALDDEDACGRRSRVVLMLRRWHQVGDDVSASRK
jgi:hypothetical protein